MNLESKEGERLMGEGGERLWKMEKGKEVEEWPNYITFSSQISNAASSQLHHPS